jgi:hypothetical protein
MLKSYEAKVINCQRFAFWGLPVKWKTILPELRTPGILILDFNILIVE